MLPLIKPSILVDLLKTRHIVLVDARSGPDAHARYEAGHLPGAIHVDLDKDLSQKSASAADGGRHPLPTIENFAVLLGRLGISPSSHVIVYDDKSGANAASRFWWMLKAVNHQAVQVLDGGMNAAIADGMVLTKEASQPASVAAYPVKQWSRQLADIEIVALAVNDPGKLVIDVREAYRYRGESEPFDKVAGHIPGTTNIPYTGNLDNEGKFLSTEELTAKYKAAIGNHEGSEIIVHCGSGVTACHTLLALEQAGITGAALYVGSWSEWSSNDRPVATGD